MNPVKLRIALLVLVLGVAGAGNVWAGGYWAGGHYPHARYSVGVGVGPYWGSSFYAPYPYYPAYAPYYYPPVVIERPAPPVYVEQLPPPVVQPAPVVAAPPANFWYYCAATKAYYPYVKACPGGWQQVSPQPPGQP